MSLRPGGGLTVLLGVLKGIDAQVDVLVESIVICSCDDTKKALEAQGIASRIVQPLKNPSQISQLAFAINGLANLVNKLSGDILLSVNRFVEHVKCPQVVYHINLLRFFPIDPSFGFTRRIAERIRNRGAKQALKKATANVFESEYLRECANKVHSRRNHFDQVIYIGLPDTLLSSRPRNEIEGVDNSQIISITNYNQHKDNPTLIDTLATLVDKSPSFDWKLKIAGGNNPSQWQPVRELAKSKNMLSRIEWTGFLDQAELTRLLENSLCMISTSRVESFCMVALESMARGCPAIVANCASMPESVGEAALLADPGDSNSFANQVQRIQEDPKLRSKLVGQGYQHIQKFRWDDCGRKFVELFVSITR